MSRQCACGGLIRTHELTDGRTAWTCKDCGRYEAMTPRATVADVEPTHLTAKPPSDPLPVIGEVAA